MSEVANPQTVTDISFFLFPQAASIMTPLVGAILYFATGPGFNNWEILGSITLEKPSATFRTG